MKVFRLYTVLAVVMIITFTTAFGQELSEKEKARKALNADFDKLRLREKTEFVIDRSEEFLARPDTQFTDTEFTIAKVPPTVKLRILPDLVPEYFTEGQQYMAAWANWANVTRSEDNRFFFSVGDHRGQGCQLNIYEYCPARNVVFRVVDVKKLLGWTDESYTDGKIHGNMGIMPDGTLWATTHYGAIPDSTWYANGFRGSWMLSYNIYTHEAKNWGNPLIPSNLPCFTVDTKRGRLMATGSFQTVLLWDCIEKKVRYAGCPPNGWVWWERSMLLDEATGKFWSVDYKDSKVRFLSFDPEFNTFERYEVSPPENPYLKVVALTRGHTEQPAMDGWYYWATWNGGFFKFKPGGSTGPIVESIGVTWDKGRDCKAIVLDPTGRYVYYLPMGPYSPIIQYDVKTQTKKVLCWLQEYYLDKYGYWMDACFGMNISNDGSFLVFNMNGEFQGRSTPFGHPSLLVVEIPPEERQP